MSAPIPLRRDFGASQLRGLAKKTKDGPQARRLLALAATYDGATRTEAAMIGGAGLQIIRDWALHFNERGPLHKEGDDLMSATRYALMMLRCSRSRPTKAAVHWLMIEGVVVPKNPTVGSFPSCCACAASGQAAAPPSSVMKERRLIRSPRRRAQAACPVRRGQEI